MSTVDFDVIVVGAGPAGSSAAWRLARAGKKVALFERGVAPGTKNLFGGMIYSLELAEHFPHFMEEAPLERPVTRHDTWFLAEHGRSVNLNFSCEPFGNAPYHGFTAYRSRFDSWLADQAVQAGAVLLSSTTVDRLCFDQQGVVCGVAVQREEGVVKAPLVICADGILSLLGEQAGLIQNRPAHCYSVGVREVLALPSTVIEDRFQIDSIGGCAALFVGQWPGQLQGGGFIYTNRDTLSIGFVAQLHTLKRQGLSVVEALQHFKQQPAVRRLIQGGERLEYGAHMVPEGGWNMRPPTLIRDGMMLCGDAAALVLAAGVIYEGVHYAMHSGLLAAETALEALEKGNFSKRVLRRYPQRLYASYVAHNLKAFRHAPQVLANPRMYQAYPELLCRVAERFFRAERSGHLKLGRLLSQEIRRTVGLGTVIKDGWRIARAFL